MFPLYGLYLQDVLIIQNCSWTAIKKATEIDTLIFFSLITGMTRCVDLKKKNCYPFTNY